MRDFIEKLVLAVAPLVVGHVLEVRKEARGIERAMRGQPQSFAAYVARQK